ncbi:hypothetical protein H238_3193 [Klebsiella pneumoniae UHKPC179]|nr:hypothetical protein P243_0730 [Klebsiella pneumoniae subsp. pneumoniae 1158]AWF48333.1 hypothetical protein CSC13_1033 [Klebsiella pneumoniae]EPA88161.1 hypothetical protein H237_3202 [Klebsiella pneumoniae UHKPC57]EPO89589.1 hypothetical protein H238_3193 [Klebsiella pneumoniae UHKPC179]CDL13911.1 hypothetical protein [Klebsiella pneumoniae IS46]
MAEKLTVVEEEPAYTDVVSANNMPDNIKPTSFVERVRSL